FLHCSTLLPDGQVLVEGGFGTNSNVTSAELYNPNTTNWTTVGSLHDSRSSHTATLLPNGNVLVAGGFSAGTTLSSVEIYNRLARTWTTVSAMNTNVNRHTATMLPNGTVLVAGGQNNIGFSMTLTEVFDPALGAWLPSGMLNT